MTRSAKKKKGNLAALDVEGKGVALTFSPPDQKENARREKAELEAKLEDRDRRIEEEKQKKRLLIFSPNSMTCRNFNFNENEEVANHSPNQTQPSPDGTETDDKQSSFELSQVSAGVHASSGSHMSDMSSSQHQADLEIRDDIKAIKETLVGLVDKDKRNSIAGLQIQQDRCALDAERAKTEELRAAKTTLEIKVSELQTSVHGSQKEYEAAKQSFEDKIKSLKDELSTLQGDKSDLLSQISALEKDLKDTRDLLSTNKADSQAIQELMAQIEVLKDQERENSKLKEDLEQLQNMLTNMRSANEELQTQLKAELEKSTKIKGQLATLESTNEELVAQIKTMELDLKESATKSDSQLNAVLAQYKKKEAEREDAISDLMERLEALRQEKEDTNAEVEKLNEELRKIKESKEAQDKQLSDLKLKHRQTKESFTREKEEVEESLGTLKSSLEKNAEELVRTQAESSQKTATIAKLEAALKDAVSRLSTSDDREDELLRKLAASDRVRAALHNRVTQLSGNIRVFVRVRPTIPGEEEKLQKDESKKRRNKHCIENTESPFQFPGALDPSSMQGDADDLTKRMIEIKEPPKDRGGLSDRRKQWRFPFDAVFTPENSQEDVWNGVGKNIPENCIFHRATLTLAFNTNSCSRASRAKRN